jgi:hypothetical protein
VKYLINISKHDLIPYVARNGYWFSIWKPMDFMKAIYWSGFIEFNIRFKMNLYEDVALYEKYVTVEEHCVLFLIFIQVDSKIMSYHKVLQC